MKKGIQYILAGLGLTGLAILIYQANLSNKSLPKRELPVLGNEGHQVKDFSLLDKDGHIFTQKEAAGKVRVVEYFFTTCQSICIPMNKNMRLVDSAFKGRSDFLILSHTVDPEVDSPAVLREYAQSHQASDTWKFLTGDKSVLYKMAIESYLLVEPEKSKTLPEFIHSNLFILVDKKGKLRGQYDGTSEKEVRRLIGDCQILLDSDPSSH